MGRICVSVRSFTEQGKSLPDFLDIKVKFFIVAKNKKNVEESK